MRIAVKGLLQIHSNHLIVQVPQSWRRLESKSLWGKVPCIRDVPPFSRSPQGFEASKQNTNLLLKRLLTSSVLNFVPVSLRYLVPRCVYLDFAAKWSDLHLYRIQVQVKGKCQGKCGNEWRHDSSLSWNYQNDNFSHSNPLDVSPPFRVILVTGLPLAARMIRCCGWLPPKSCTLKSQRKIWGNRGSIDWRCCSGWRVVGDNGYLWVFAHYTSSTSVLDNAPCLCDVSALEDIEPEFSFEHAESAKKHNRVQ